MWQTTYQLVSLISAINSIDGQKWTDILPKCMILPEPEAMNMKSTFPNTGWKNCIQKILRLHEKLPNFPRQFWDSPQDAQVVE